MVVYEHCEHDKRRRTLEFDEEDIDDLLGRKVSAVDETWDSFSIELVGMILGGGNRNNGWEYWSKRFRKNASWYSRNEGSDSKSNRGGG